MKFYKVGFTIKDTADSQKRNGFTKYFETFEEAEEFETYLREKIVPYVNAVKDIHADTFQELMNDAAFGERYPNSKNYKVSWGDEANVSYCCIYINVLEVAKENLNRIKSKADYVIHSHMKNISVKTDISEEYEPINGSKAV